ncbi:MAG: S49 family peptidase [Gemmataceae bacterium]|nr:S49 family peptidase [Gemmataceae bacterium]
MRLVLCALLAMTTVGCHQPLRVVSDGRVELTGPLQVPATLDFAPAIPAVKGGKVRAMPLGSCDADPQGPRIALVDVDGLLLNQNLNGSFTLGDNPVAIFQEKLDAVAADANVCAVVVRINSPGGSVTATDMMWHELQRFKTVTGKPVVACLLDVGAGGAYYLATAADHIVAHPTTLTGGIGVIWNSYNLRDFIGLVNILPQSVKAGPNIDMGSTAQALTPEAKNLLQQIADDFHGRFKAIVLKSRPKVNPADAKTFDGQIFTAAQAQQRRLIDTIGYLDDAVAAARQLGRCPDAVTVMYHRTNDPAHSPYAVSGHLAPMAPLLPFQIPGLDRSRLPTFLYLWQPEPMLDNR